jgi:uncharacterized membrane protein
MWKVNVALIVAVLLVVGVVVVALVFFHGSDAGNYPSR